MKTLVLDFDAYAQVLKKQAVRDGKTRRLRLRPRRRERSRSPLRSCPPPARLEERDAPPPFPALADSGESCREPFPARMGIAESGPQPFPARMGIAQSCRSPFRLQMGEPDSLPEPFRG